MLFALGPYELRHSNRFMILPAEQPVHVDRVVLAHRYKFPTSYRRHLFGTCAPRLRCPGWQRWGETRRSDRMSLNRNSRKQKLLMAAAAMAFICGSDFALAQRVEGSGNIQGGANVQSGERSGAREGTGGATQRRQPGMRERSGAETKGSNARGAQGPERDRRT